MRKNLIYPAISTLLILSLMGCGKKEETKEDIKNTIVATDFVSYDVTRQLIKDTDLSVELVDTSEELSGRDRNKINKSLLFINTGDDLENIDDEVKENSIKIKDIIEQKENSKDDNKIYSDSFSLISQKDDSDAEETSENKQIVISTNKNNTGDDSDSSEKDKNNGSDGSDADNNSGDSDSDSADGSDNSANNSDNSNNSSNSDNSNSSGDVATEATGSSNESDGDDAIYYKDGLRLEYKHNDFSEPAPCSADENGYSLGNFPLEYQIQEGDDEYQSWLIRRIMSLTDDTLYVAIDNGNGTYTIFRAVGLIVNRYKVITIDDIYIPNVLGDAVLVCEDTITIASAGDKMQYLADTKDMATGYWLDVKNTQVLETAIKDKLVELVPEYAETIEANYNEYDSELTSLDDKFQYVVDSSENKTIFIGGAFVYKYMTDGYGINYVSIYDYSTQETPSITRLSNFAKVLNDYGIKYVIKDKQSTSEGIDSIKTEVKQNVNTVIIDTMAEVDDLDETYLDIMNDNYIILKKAIY